MKETVQRCAVCQLPGNYPGISFNQENKCVFCQREEDPSSRISIHYQGVPALLDRIAELKKQYPDQNPEYDGILGYSGGIDSTYLLYLLTQKLHLKILAVSMTHRFIPPETADNIRRIAESLGVRCQFVPNPFLDKWAAYFIRNWSHKPSAPALINFCTGCRYGLTHLLPEIARKNKIHILFTGETPFEATTFKRDIVNLHPEHPTTSGLILGYGRELLKNLHYFKNPAAVLFQVREFLAHRSFEKNLIKHQIAHLTPFSGYIEWKQEDVKKVLEELHWQKSSAAVSEWRSDCFINFIRQYYYKRILGFNDNDFKNAALLRKGNGELAVQMDQKQQDEVARKILKEHFKLDFDCIEKKISRDQKS